MKIMASDSSKTFHNSVTGIVSSVPAWEWVREAT